MHLKPNESPYAIASFRLVIVMQITAEVLALTLVYLTLRNELHECPSDNKATSSFRSTESNNNDDNSGLGKRNFLSCL
jgi:hypothetical protein